MPYVKPKPPPSPPRPDTSLPPLFLPADYSPPPSPVTTIPLATDDESDLSDSWLEVEDQSSAGRSSVGPSVLGDSAFSDTSSDSPDNEIGHGHDREHEAPSHWSYSSDGDFSDHDEPGDVTIAPDPSSIGSPSLAGGEYTDAEASVSRLDSSVGTIHRDQVELSPTSSQIRLIFPDPGSSSFSSSSGTLSAGFTPSASVARLTPMAQPDQAQRLRDGLGQTSAASPLTSRPSSRPSGRGVNDSWLRSTKLWTPPSEMDQSGTSEKYDYQLLSSTDDIDHIEDLTLKHEDEQLRMPKVDVAKDERDVDAATSFPGSSKDLTDKSFPVSCREQADDVLEVFALEHAIKPNYLAQLKLTAKRWTTPMSLLALASVLSLALYQSLGPNAVLFSLSQPSQPGVTAPTSVTTPVHTVKPPSIWDSLPFLPISLVSTSTPAASSPTAIQPDLQVIRHALSTLSTLQDKLSSAANRASTTDPIKTKQEAPIAPKDQNLRSSTSCCSVSIRDDRVSLTVSGPAAENEISLAKRITQKLLGADKTGETVETATAAETTASPDCTCSLSTYTQTEFLARIASTFASGRYYALTTSQYFSHIFGPLLASLEHELAALANLTRRYTSAASSVSRSALNNASREATYVVGRVNTAVHRATNDMSSFFTSRKDGRQDQPGPSAHDLLDSLSEYVEARLDGLSDMIAEEAEVMQEKGWDCIYQAKSGLDRLISDVKKLHPKIKEGDGKTTKPKAASSEVEVETDGPLPFAHMEVHKPITRLSRRERSQDGPGARARTRGLARRERREERRYVERKLRGKKVNVIVPPIPAPEKPSKAKRMMDLVHHGAMALVI
ncbi:hypothetical protein IAT40_005543 [Kwoniella sp. CBS 6097]